MNWQRTPGVRRVQRLAPSEVLAVHGLGAKHRQPPIGTIAAVNAEPTNRAQRRLLARFKRMAKQGRL
jgi:hypothetical protein